MLTSHDYYGIGYSSDADHTRSYEYTTHNGKTSMEKMKTNHRFMRLKTESWRIVHASPLDWKVDSFRPGLSDKGKMY